MKKFRLQNNKPEHLNSSATDEQLRSSRGAAAGRRSSGREKCRYVFVGPPDEGPLFQNISDPLAVTILQCRTDLAGLI